MGEDILFKKIGQRIVEAREAKGLKQAGLAIELEVTQSTLSSWERGIRRPKRDNLERLAEALDVGKAWIETGDNGKISHITTIESALNDGLITVPEYNIRLSAGGGYVVDEETILEQWVFTKSYLSEMRLLAADLVVAEVEGDSMEPKLFSGDRVMVNQTDKDANRPGIFAVWDTSALVVKRIEKIPGTDPVMLRLISDNPNHSKYDVLAEDTRIIGRVVWFARRL